MLLFNILHWRTLRGRRGHNITHVATLPLNLFHCMALGREGGERAQHYTWPHCHSTSSTASMALGGRKGHNAQYYTSSLIRELQEKAVPLSHNHVVCSLCSL